MIGVFDSGQGGLTVLKEIKEIAPDLDVVYFGDLRNAPYGDRNTAELGALTAMAFQKLIDAGATKIVTACNSVSVLLMQSMLDVLNLKANDVIEMVHPTVRYIESKGYKHILLVATQATVQSGMYQRSLELRGIRAHALAIPGLVDRIEAGADDADIREHILSFKHTMSLESIDALVLGCTQFPLVEGIFREIFGDGVRLVDPALPVAQEVLNRFGSEGAGTTRFLISKESRIFRNTVENMFPGGNNDVHVL